MDGSFFGKRVCVCVIFVVEMNGLPIARVNGISAEFSVEVRCG